MQPPKTDIRSKAKNIQKVHVRNKSNHFIEKQLGNSSSDNQNGQSKRTFVSQALYANNQMIRYNDVPAQTNSGNCTEYAKNKGMRLNEIPPPDSVIDETEYVHQA